MVLTRGSSGIVWLMGFVVILAVTYYASSTGMFDGHGGVLEFSVVAAVGAVILTVLHLLFWNARAAEIRRLTTHVEKLGAGEPSTAVFGPASPLDELTDCIERTFATLHANRDALLAERHELTVQARQAESRRRRAIDLLDQLEDAVIVTDAFNEVHLLNAAARTIFSAELRGHERTPIEDVVHDATLVQAIRDMRESGSPAAKRRIEHQVETDSSMVTYDVLLTGLTSTDGDAGDQAAGVITVLHDVTREREMSKVQSEFVSHVSHELRTPLSSIKAYMEMLIDGEAEDEDTRAEFYNIIQGESNRLSRLIDNVLNISRIESGVARSERRHVSLPALVREAVEVMRPQARAKDIELVETPNSLFFQVFADKDMIYQATLNLISNAIKYTPEGGRVTVSVDVDQQSRMVTVAVSDTGVGVSEPDRPHLFEKFYRVADHKKFAKGTGLGLNLVKHIIETVHGGRIDVTSCVGEGSTFTFHLPIAESD